MPREKVSIVLNFLVTSVFINLRCYSSNRYYILTTYPFYMNDPLQAIAMYFMNFLYFSKQSRNCFAVVSSFSVISGIFTLWRLRRHLTPFHKIPKIKSGIVSDMLLHDLTKCGSDWAIFYLFMTSNVHRFFTTFFADQSWASSSLVVSDYQS